MTKKKIHPAISRNNKNRNVQKTAQSQIQNFPFLLCGIFFILLQLFLASPTIQRGWGLNYIRFFELPTVILFYLALTAMLFPPANEGTINVVTGVAARTEIIASIKRFRIVLFALISICAGFVFYSLRVKYVFLGDAGVRPAQIETGEIMNSEYFTMWTLIHLYRWLHAAWEYTGMQTVRLVSYITGGLFTFVSLLTADAVGKTFLKKAACFTVSTLSLAALMQFCGYAEMYAIPLFFLQLYLYLCVMYLQRHVSILLPVLCLATGCGFHLMLACMIPSLAFLFYGNILWKYPFFRKKSTLTALVIILSVIICYGLGHFTSMMLPIASGSNNVMTLFSVVHYKEFFNSQLLGGGIIFVIWIAVLIFLCIRRIRLDITGWFFVVASLSITGFVFVYDMWRGSGDWDIYSFAAIVYNIATAFLLLMLHERKIIANLKQGICILSVFALLHSSFWIITNHTDKSVGWVETAFATDPGSYYKNSFSNESMLGALFTSNELKEKSLEWEKKAWFRHRNDPRTGYNYANVLIREEKMEEAMQILEQSVVNFPAYAPPYAQLVNLYIDSKNYDKLYHLLLQMESIYKQTPEAFTSRFTKEQTDRYFNMLEQLKTLQQ